MGVFWNRDWMELQVKSICSAYEKFTYQMMRYLYNRFGFPAVPVTKVRETLLRCVDSRENISQGKQKKDPGFAGPPECGLRSLLVGDYWTRSRGRNLIERNVVWDPVTRVKVPHASVHALGLALIVTSAIAEPARVVAVESALILR
jgi:hypothetical protein